MPIVPLNGVDVYYEVHGDGPPAVVMGGWGTFCHGGERSVPRAVLEDRRVVIFDYRGIGESTDDPESIPSMRLYADDLAELLHHLGTGPVDVVGMVGMGACIGQELAINHPDLCRSLLMTGTWAKPDPMFIDQIEGFRRAHLDGGFPTFQRLVASFSFTRDFYNRNRDRLLGPTGAWSDLIGRETAHSRLIDACLSHDTTDRLDRITCPTLVVHAGGDMITAPEMTRVLEDGIPNARGIHWEEIGHVIAGKDQKIRFDEIIRGFFAEVETGSAP